MSRSLFYSNSDVACNISSDCSVVDKEGNVIVMNCFLESAGISDVNFCGCSATYGWTGEFCDKTSVQLRLLLVFSFIRIIMSSLLVFWCILLLLRLLSLDEGANSTSTRRVEKRQKAINRLKKILMFIILGLLCSWVYSAFSFAAAFDNTQFELYTFRYFLDEDQVIVNQKNGVIIDLTTLGVIVFAICASLQISLSWVELIERYEAVFKKLKHPRKIRYYKESVKYITTLLIVFSFSFVAIGYLIPAFAAGMVTTLLLLMLFLVGRHSLVKQLQGSKAKSKSGIKLFNNSTKGHVILLGLLCLCMIGFAAFDGIEVLPGEIKPSIAALNLILQFTLFLMLYDLWYVDQVMKNLVKAVSPEGFSSWRVVDTKSTKIVA